MKRSIRKKQHIVTRKEKRKEARKSKKQRRQQYFGGKANGKKAGELITSVKDNQTSSFNRGGEDKVNTYRKGVKVRTKLRFSLSFTLSILLYTITVMFCGKHRDLHI